MTKTSPWGLSSLTLRHLAMFIMVIDHIGLVFFPDQLIWRYIGRLAFPIFAFLVVEGYLHTKNFVYYLCRLLVFALLTDLPYYFMTNGRWLYQPFKNVIWTFLIGLITIWLIDKSKRHFPLLLYIITSLIIFACACWLANFWETDYHDWGIMTLAGFYVFRGKLLQHRLAQTLVFLVVNCILPNLVLFQLVNFDNFELYWEHYGIRLFSPQMFAVLALPIIWTYNGQLGYHTRFSQIINYLFYPLHMLIIGLIAYF